MKYRAGWPPRDVLRYRAAFPGLIWRRSYADDTVIDGQLCSAHYEVEGEQLIEFLTLALECSEASARDLLGL